MSLKSLVLSSGLQILFSVYIDEKVFKLSVSSFPLKFELGSLVISLEAYKSPVIFYIKLLELLLYKLICFILIPKSIKTCINNEDDTSPLNIELAQHLIDYSPIHPINIAVWQF